MFNSIQYDFDIISKNYCLAKVEVIVIALAPLPEVLETTIFLFVNDSIFITSPSMVIVLVVTLTEYAPLSVVGGVQTTPASVIVYVPFEAKAVTSSLSHASKKVLSFNTSLDVPPASRVTLAILYEPTMFVTLM